MAKKKSASEKSKKGFIIEITPFSSLLWVAGFLFFLAWVFILGFFVGRGFLPESVTALSDMKTRIKRIQSMINGDKPVQEADREKKEDPKLAFYERLSSKKNEVKRQWQEPKKGETTDKHVPKLKENISLRDQTETGSGLHKSIAEKEVGASEPDFFFTIQLASLKDANSAEALVDRLKRKGYSVYYYEVEIKDRVYYRVRCGRYPTREEAENYARGLAQKEGIKGFVTTLD